MAALCCYPTPALPPVTLEDAKLLPPHEACVARCDFALAHYRWAQGMAKEGVDERTRALWRAREFDAWETWWVWDNARIATDETQGTVTRIQWLKDNRTRMGAERFYAGVMPTPAPVWYFTRVP